MAVDAYLVITPYAGSGATGGYGRPLTTDGVAAPTLTKDLANVAIAPGSLIEVSDYNVEIEQVLNIGSPAGGAGAGKLAFDAFTVSKRLDAVSTILFQNCATGLAFAKLDVLLVKSGVATPQLYLQHTFKFAAVATISYSQDDEGELERVSFEFGDAQIRYATQNPDGTTGKVLIAGWNRIKNIADLGPDPIST
jgi:type VI protein secretion system component Hcp